MPRVKKSEFYKILGIKSTATLLEIKQAYRKFALVFHPDRNVNKSENKRLEAEKKFKEIQEAYDYLITNYKEFKKRKLPQQKKKKLPKKQSHNKIKKLLKKQNQNKK
ncbi:DnaJ domain-containing protein [Gigaspora rosea]|uniref:DnaJ domain-containing protein n=1 Tax=Gigaspora rosea TaxID=44941 RepID=A0A397UJ02_9GLOM|nr:DnaJ domain-containing protein [Gigaspora rosea]